MLKRARGGPSYGPIRGIKVAVALSPLRPRLLTGPVGAPYVRTAGPLDRGLDEWPSIRALRGQRGRAHDQDEPAPARAPHGANILCGIQTPPIKVVLPGAPAAGRRAPLTTKITKENNKELDVVAASRTAPTPIIRTTARVGHRVLFAHPDRPPRLTLGLTDVGPDPSDG